MGKFTMTHDLDCDLDTFWKVFFDKEFNTALFARGLQFPKYDILEQRENDKEIYRRVQTTPKMDVPGPVAKLLGGSFSYVEEGTFDKASRIWKWKIIPSALSDKLRNEGVIRAEANGANRVRRISDVTIEAKIFGLGGLMENAAETNLRRGWDASARFMNTWLKDHK